LKTRSLLDGASSAGPLEIMKKYFASLTKSSKTDRATDASMSRSSAVSLVTLGILLLTGCASPIADPSRLVERATPPEAPPTGSSLVQIHRPRAAQGYKLYTGVWDSTNMIADLGNGHSVAYVCAPGKHYFINRSVERVGVVEAQLLPDKTYDLRLDTAGAFIASFQLEPIKRGDKLRELTTKWAQEHIWVTRGPLAAEYEQKSRKELELIIHDFVFGEKKDRLRHLDPDDHR